MADDEEPDSADGEGFFRSGELLRVIPSIEESELAVEGLRGFDRFSVLVLRAGASAFFSDFVDASALVEAAVDAEVSLATLASAETGSSRSVSGEPESLFVADDEL